MEKRENTLKLSHKEWNGYPAFFTETKNTLRATKKVLEEGALESYEGKPIVTNTDAFFTPSEYFPDTRKNIIRGTDILEKRDETKIFSLLLTELGASSFEKENIPETLKMLTQALFYAKKYMEEYLSLELPSDIKRINSFKNTNDLFMFLRKTTGLKSGEALGNSPYYCALVQVMRAELEYKRGDFDRLEQDAEWLENEIFEQKGKEFLHFIKRGNIDKDWNEIVVVSDNMEEAPSTARFSSRGKTHERAVTKMLAKVHFSSSEAINDGIGLRMEVPNNVKEQELIPFLARYFTKRFKASHLECKDNNFCEKVNEDDLANFKSSLEEEDVVFVPQDNAVSNKKYKAIDLKGYLRISDKKKQPFEIQIVRLGNENEDGMSRHEIYEPLQKMVVKTRLLGSFSEKYLDLLVNEAAEETGFSKEKIKKYYLEHALVEVKSSQRNRRIKSFAAKKTFLRLQEGNLVPSRIKLRKPD